VSQFPPDEVVACALQLTVLVAVTDTVCAGTVAPAAPMNVSEAGLAVSGTPCTSVRVTATCWTTPPEVIVIVPLYVPTARTPVETETVAVAGVLPEAGDTESQLPPNGVVTLADAVKEVLVLLPNVKDCAAIEPP